MNQPAGANWAVELRRFAKSYGNGWTGRRTVAVAGLTLRLPAGQIVGLLGPNGSGKSTTLRALAGLLRPSAGECLVFGHAAGSSAARALVGYQPDAAGFAPNCTGTEFLLYCAGLSGLSSATARDRVQEVLRWSRLDEAASRKIGGYSKGMRQRLGLAQAILHEPPLVLLDEPAGGLDPAGRLLLNQLIRDLAARGRTVVFSSHLLTQAEELCDHVVLLGRGRLLAEGSPRELLGNAWSPAPPPSPLEQLYLERMAADA